MACSVELVATTATYTPECCSYSKQVLTSETDVKLVITCFDQKSLSIVTEIGSLAACRKFSVRMKKRLEEIFISDEFFLCWIDWFNHRATKSTTEQGRFQSGSCFFLRLLRFCSLIFVKSHRDIFARARRKKKNGCARLWLDEEGNKRE